MAPTEIGSTKYLFVPLIANQCRSGVCWNQCWNETSVFVMCGDLWVVLTFKCASLGDHKTRPLDSSVSREASRRQRGGLDVHRTEQHPATENESLLMNRLSRQISAPSCSLGYWNKI